MKKNNITAFVLILIAGIWAVLHGGGNTMIYYQAMGNIPIIFGGGMIPFVSGFTLVFGVFNLVLGIAMLIGSIQVKSNKRSGAILTLIVSIPFLISTLIVSIPFLISISIAIILQDFTPGIFQDFIRGIFYFIPGVLGLIGAILAFRKK